MKIAALGPEGTHSHELAARLSDDILLLPTIDQICAWVEEGAGTGLVPIENSEAGGVGATLTCLRTRDVYITGEAYVHIRHHLASRSDLSGIEIIYVHPQTHEQCSRYVESLGIEVVHTSSNAASALAVLKNERSGAIISGYAADLYGIPVIARDVQNSSNNITRFVLISRERCMSGTFTKCSILIDPRTDRAGLLHDLLAVFADYGINLTRIESRPSGRGIGSYIFFIDYEFGKFSGKALDDLKEMAPVKEFGCYTGVTLDQIFDGSATASVQHTSLGGGVRTPFQRNGVCNMREPEP